MVSFWEITRQVEHGKTRRVSEQIIENHVAYSPLNDEQYVFAVMSVTCDSANHSTPYSRYFLRVATFATDTPKRTYSRGSPRALMR